MLDSYNNSLIRIQAAWVVIFGKVFSDVSKLYAAIIFTFMVVTDQK